MRFLFLILIFLTIPVQAAVKDVSLLLSWKHQFQFAGYYLAKEKGFYKEEGLNVSIKEYSLDDNVTRDVSTQKFDFGIGHSSLILDRQNKYKNIVLLAAIHQSSPLILLAKKRPDIRNISDLANKKIMVTSDNTFTASIKAMLTSEKLKVNDFIAIKHSFQPVDLINGKADLMIAYVSNEVFFLQEKGIDYTIFDPKDYGYDFYSDFLFTSSELLQKDPDTVNAFYKASIRGWLYAYTHIEESIDVILRHYNSQNKTRKALRFEAQSLKKLAFREGVDFGHIAPFRIREMLNTYRLLRLTKSKNFDLDDLIFQPAQQPKPEKMVLSREQRTYLANKGIINLCIASDNMPFEAINNNQMSGIAADIVLAIKNHINITFNYVETTDVYQSFEFLKQKKCDIIPVVTKNVVRDPDIKTTIPYIRIPLVLVTHKDSPFIYSLQSINNMPIAIVKNQNFMENFSQRKVYPINSLDEGLAQIAADEEYGMIANIATLKKTLERNMLSTFQFNHAIDQTMPVVIAFRAEDKILYDIFTKQLQLTKASDVSRIMNKWLAVEQNTQRLNPKLIMLLLIGLITILVLVQLTNIRLKRLVKEKTGEINQQIKVFDKNISASRTDVNGVITYASEAFCKESGYSEAELLGKTHAVINDSETADEVYQDLWLTIKSGHIWKGEFKNKRKNGQEYWVYTIISPVFDKDKKITAFNAIRNDVTLKKVLLDFNQKLEEEVVNRTEELIQNQHYLDTLFDVNPSIAFVVKGNQLERVNKAFLEFTHYQSLDDFLQKHHCISELFEQRGGYEKPDYDPVKGTQYPIADENRSYKCVMFNRDKEHIFSINVQQFSLNDEPHCLVILEDITKIEKTAITDKLTGISNRARIDDCLTLYNEKFQRYNQMFSIILIDVDHFKLINKIFGYPVGDDLLRQIATLISQNSRSIDITGRWGGEAFIIICPATDVNYAFLFAEKIRKLIMSYSFNHQKDITISLGVAEISAGMTENDIIRKAEKALHKAKRNGRNNTVQG